MERNGPPPAANALLLAVVALVGLNLRPFITGVGPLATAVSAGTGLGLQGMALLTLVPMLLMGVFAFAGPSMQAKVGARRSVVAALAVLTLGSFLRLFVATGWQMVGTAALLGLGAAIVQAVFPGIVKQQFPRHVGLVMGLYSAMLMGGGALGAQIAPLIAGGAGDWHVGLAWMAVPALAAVILAALCLPRDGRKRAGGNAAAAFLKRPRTWLLMACFGPVNGGYSTAVAWLAPSYQEHGWSSGASGGLLAIMAVAQACAALLLPVLAGRREDRRPWLWLTLIMQAAGFAALAFRPEAAPVLWAVLLGAGLGGCFSLSMIVALDHLPDPAEAGALSALMQGGGFLIAAMPPWIVAVLHDLTGGFVAGWLLHLACVVVVTVLYWRVTPKSYGPAMKAPGGEAEPHRLQRAGC
jgi:CP family cyanate transporter-like MFS transporter